jgi:hypothetical protein
MNVTLILPRLTSYELIPSIDSHVYHVIVDLILVLLPVLYCHRRNVRCCKSYIKLYRGVLMAWINSMDARRPAKTDEPLRPNIG